MFYINELETLLVLVDVLIKILVEFSSGLREQYSQSLKNPSLSL